MPPVNITSCDYVKRHILEFAPSRIVYKIGTMAAETKYQFWEQGRRLRWLRQAEKFQNQAAFARYVGWGNNQSGVSQFESGFRRVPMDKALQLRAKIPGFDPIWLWEGDKRGLSFDLRLRIEEEEAKDDPPQSGKDNPDEVRPKIADN